MNPLDRIIRCLAGGIERDALADDLLEEYRFRKAESGRLAAMLWYAIQFVRVVPSLLFYSLFWRGIMTGNYLKIALRNIRRKMGFSLINIIGLAVGMAAAILILLWVQHELSFDRFHEKGGRICKVIQHITFETESTWAISQGPLGPALKEEIPEIEDFLRVKETGWRMIVDDQVFREWGAYVDASFFSIFDFHLISGDPATALSDPHSVILTSSLAKKMFGDNNPLGRTVNLDHRLDFRVTGVIEDFPANSHLNFNFLGTMEYAYETGVSVRHWKNSTFGTYVLLRPDASRDAVASKIEFFLDEKPNLEERARLDLLPLKDIHFTSHMDFDYYGTGNFQYVIIFLVSALFILIIACINFMNLSTALSTMRSREVSLRKVVGARRKQIIGQFLGESLVLTLLAFLLTLILVSLLLPVFNELTGKSFTLTVLLDGPVMLGMGVILLFTGLASGSYPALWVSSFSPASVLRSGRLTGAGNSTLRKALVVVQFTLSVILLAGTFVVYAQIRYMQNKPLGYDKENLICLRVNPDIRSQYDAFKNVLSGHPDITDVTGVADLPTYGYSFSNSLWHWEGQDPDKETLFRCNYIDYDYFSTFRINMVAGREFSREMTSDSSAVVINEAAQKAMGLENPVGRIIDYNHQYKMIIIGVAADYNFRSLHSTIDPLILIHSASRGYLVCRVREEHLPQTLAYMEEKWNEFSPNYAFNHFFLDERLDRLYQTEQSIGNILKAFTLLAVLVACLGLFGLASFMAVRRNKEIGVRKVLGAREGGIVLLLVREFTKWVLVANLLAWPVTWYVMTRWLENFAYKRAVPLSAFLFTGVITLLIALATVSFQAVKAARTNPVDSLRYE